MLKLKTVLRSIGQTQADLARAVNLSPATVAQLINHRHWPKSVDCKDLRKRIRGFLKDHGADSASTASAFDVMGPPHCHVTAPDCAQNNNQSQEDEHMLLRKQTLLPATKKVFSMPRDPFAELQEADDMWLSPDIRYVREAMYQTARHGGFLAVLGESGAGKSTLRRDLVHRLEADKQPVIIVQPYVLAMEDNDSKGKTLKSTHIAEALLSAVAPLERIKSSPQARFAQLERALKESHAAGYRHCLVMEEAHSMPIPTLKHLKRILELEHGFTKLLSIILIGQPELAVKLSERNAEVREVVQRCEIVTLTPIDPGRLAEFLAYRFGRTGKKLQEVIDDTGIQSLAERLTLPSRGGRDEGVSQLYPLAIGNLVIASMNLAATLGVPMVTGDIVKGV